jgi:hypothetical protein
LRGGEESVGEINKWGVDKLGIEVEQDMQLICRKNNGRRQIQSQERVRRRAWSVGEIGRVADALCLVIIGIEGATRRLRVLIKSDVFLAHISQSSRALTLATHTARFFSRVGEVVELVLPKKTHVTALS